MSQPELKEAIAKQAVTATQQIFQSYMDNFQESGKDHSYKRAVFRQGKDEYAGNCTMIIDVRIELGGDMTHIITKFGTSS